MANSFVRVPFVARASVVTGGTTRQATICNLSIGGLYLQSPVAPEGELSVRFHLPDGGALIEATAAAAWVNDRVPDTMLALPMGFGARFTSLAPHDGCRIERLVDSFRVASEPLAGAVQLRAGAIRIPLAVPCRLVGPFGLAQGTTCNLSALGVYAAVDRIPDVGDTVHVELALPGYPGGLECAGTITWQNPHPQESPRSLPPGCGVRLRNLADDDLRSLIGLVSDYFASPPPPG
jgi:hypothetical protein